MEWLFNAQTWIGLFTLTALEIVLGIDNIVFIAVLAGRLPPTTQERARRTGLLLAMLIRILLLLSIFWIMGLNKPLFSFKSFDLTGRELILVAGGLFLIAKSTREIHHKLEEIDEGVAVRAAPTFASVLIQILLLDIVFSLDSVITAVGMVDHIGIMIAAIVLAVGAMLLFAGAVSRFVNRHPTLKMLALSFLLLIGMNLIADGVGFHIPKGYTYFAMAFSVFVEMLNLRVRKAKKKHVKTNN